MLRVFLLLYLGIWLVGLIAHRLFRRRLRKIAPKVAAQVSPGPAGKTRLRDWRGAAYLFQRKYRALDDPVLTKLGDVSLFAALLAAISLLGALFWMFFNGIGMAPEMPGQVDATPRG